MPPEKKIKYLYLISTNRPAMKIYKSLFFLFFLGCFTSHAQYTETINTNRPGDSQGAFAVGPGVLQLETGGKYGGGRHILLQTETDIWGIDYAVRYGILFEELEINLTGSFLDSSVNYEVGTETETRQFRNFDENAIGAKYLIYDPYKNAKEKKPNLYSWNAAPEFYWSDLIPAISVYAGLNFSFGDNPYIHEGEGNISPRVAVITQNNWGAWVLVLNLIGDKLGQTYPTYSAIATLTHSFNPKFVAFTEFQGIMSDVYSDEIVRGGVAYLFHEDMQADLSGLLNFKDTPSRWEVSLGLSYRFDWHKQDQFLERAEDLAK